MYGCQKGFYVGMNGYIQNILNIFQNNLDMLWYLLSIAQFIVGINFFHNYPSLLPCVD